VDSVRGERHENNRGLFYLLVDIMLVVIAVVVIMLMDGE